MMWWGWLLIVAIAISSIFLIGGYAYHKWQEAMKRIVAWISGFMTGAILMLIFILLLERVW